MTQTETQWLDMRQVKSETEFADVPITTLYSMLQRAAKSRAPYKEVRAVVDEHGIPRRRRLLLWTPAEVEEVKNWSMQWNPQVRGRCVTAPATESREVDDLTLELASFQKVATDIVRSATKQWRERALAAEAERDALREQLTRIKTALGVA
jgi:hypothetical protein